MTPIMIA